MNMNTKEKVLQRCRELCQTRNGVCWYIDEQTWISVRDNGPYKINSGSGSVKIGVSQNTPESDPVWPLAAQVLGVGHGESAGLATAEAAQNLRDFFAVPCPESAPIIPTLRGLLLENIKLLKAQQPAESPKPDWVKEELRDAMLDEVQKCLEFIAQEHKGCPTEVDAKSALNCLDNARKHGQIRPSDDLLRTIAARFFEKAYKMGQNHAEAKVSYPSDDIFQPIWEEYLKTIPPDTLKEDSELVKRELIDEVEKNSNFIVMDEREKAIHAALKRLCGMEVGNG